MPPFHGAVSPDGLPGAAISTSTTNHGTTKPPIGIDAILLSDLPIALQSFSVE